jgi:hypothetical protein
MSSMRSGYKELGLDIFSLEEKFSHSPNKLTMVEEKREYEVGDPIKLLLKEALT